MSEQLPMTNKRDGCRAYWKTQNLPWRTEPEIDKERQVFLLQRLSITPDIEQGIYPFKGIRLSRADIEWLLATHENGRGPVDWNDLSQRERKGLDLRGADLHDVDMIHLPLAGLCAGPTSDLWFHFLDLKKVEQWDSACAHLERANLYMAHLEGAELSGVHLEGANLSATFLEGANLSWAHLERVSFQAAHLGHAQLVGSHLEAATLSGTDMAAANLTWAHLEGACLNSVRLENSLLVEAYLGGADLYRAHLEGANLYSAYLGGVEVAPDDLERVHNWEKDFPTVLPAANLHEAFFDSTTRLSNIVLGNEICGFVSLADISWGGANIIGIDWQQVAMLGDEREALKRLTQKMLIKEKDVRLCEYRVAVRANRQLALVLQTQSLLEEAAYFAYRAQKLQKVVLRLQGKLDSYTVSWFLDLFAGYGYRVWRSLVAYLCVVGAFAILYVLFGFSPFDAILFSLTTFHGRGFFGGGIQLNTAIVPLAALEAIMGLILEIGFVAIFIQRFLRK